MIVGSFCTEALGPLFQFLVQNHGVGSGVPDNLGLGPGRRRRGLLRRRLVDDAETLLTLLDLLVDLGLL